MTYQPPRQLAPRPPVDPLEIELVYDVIPCGSCSFFWPGDPSQQPYGPYSTFDVDMRTPPPLDPLPTTPSFPWIQTVTQAPAFPNPEVLDGCRKAPIMTLGINPNLTAFAPGPTGAAWAYPGFATDEGGSLYTKYAYYYRYRTVFQESFELGFAEQFLLPDPRVVAERAGKVVKATRTSDAPSYEISVVYEGDDQPTVIPLTGELGSPPWVLLYDTYGAGAVFPAGATIAGKVDVPAGQSVEVHREAETYYTQFVPVLEHFQETVRAGGHPDAVLRMGEDVCQLDMVACASPHWSSGYLGGTVAAIDEVVDNCVMRNAWAMKQLVQTRPVVLFLVGETSYDMFVEWFGALLERDVPLPAKPADGPFTLLRETCDPAHPCTFRFETSTGGLDFSLATRVVVSPHFSYSSNFLPQYRLSPEQLTELKTSDPACATFLSSDPRLEYVAPEETGDYPAWTIPNAADVAGVRAAIDTGFPASAPVLDAGFYDARSMMAGVLDDLYSSGALSYGPAQALTRTQGACKFCVNDHWEFPLGCPYDKPPEPSPAPGVLESIAAAIVAAGRRTDGQP